MQNCTDNRKRVLLIAFACSPYRGSEDGAGWRRAVETAKYFDTWVLYGNKDNQSEITRYLKEKGEVKGLHLVYVPNSRVGNLLLRLRLPLGYYVSYNIWHRQAYLTAVKLHKKYKYSLAHQVTWSGFREPGYTLNLNNLFVWGPVGGVQNFPWRFIHQGGIANAIIEIARNIFNVIQFRFQPRVRKSAKKASLLLSANTKAAHCFDKVHKIKSVLQLEVGIDEIRNNGYRKNFTKDRPLKILWNGVFQHRKALHLLIKALGCLPESVSYELRIIGDGPMSKRWRKLAKRTNVDRNIEWIGWITHEKVFSHYEWADVFVFTSLRDTSGTVVVEALSYGVPIICLDHQGVGDIVTNECGFKVPVTKPNKVVLALCEILITIYRDRKILKELSMGAFERSKKYLWSKKGKETAKLYYDIL